MTKSDILARAAVGSRMQTTTNARRHLLSQKLKCAWNLRSTVIIVTASTHKLIGVHKATDMN